MTTEGPDEPQNVLQDAVQSFAEEVAAGHFLELTSRHSHKACVERNCPLCRELSVVKAETIMVVVEKVVDRVHDELIAAVAVMDPRTDTIDDLARQMKVRLRELLSTATPGDYWA